MGNRHFWAAALTALLAAGATGAAEPPANPMQPTPTWDDLRAVVVPADIDPPADEARLSLTAPLRAEDPALVALRVTAGADAPPLAALALVVDENPAPVAAEFTLGPAMAPLDLELRVRVNAYSNIRAIGTHADGSQLMSGRFVKASGGCSAAANKDLAVARAQMGQMRFQAVPAGDRLTGKLMIRHPMNSGLQRDQVTLLDIPAHFIDRISVHQGDDLLWTMTGGISVSEDPVFQFAYRGNGQPIRVHVEDSDGNAWDETFATGS